MASKKTYEGEVTEWMLGGFAVGKEFLSEIENHIKAQKGKRVRVTVEVLE